MVTNHHDCLKSGVATFYHQERMPAPTPQQPDLKRQLGSDYVAPASMGTFDADLAGPVFECAFTGSGDFSGHLLAKLAVFGFVIFGFIPVGGAGDALDIGADINFHLFSSGGLRLCPVGAIA